jgi:NAD(P)-dependent dehydrogenase (short-subunit alcohol dehydrogenase family)
MDLGLKGRTALVVGVGGELRTSLSATLEDEGVTVVDHPGDTVDIVVASGDGRHPALLDCHSADALHEAWTAVVDTVTTYRQALDGMVARGWGRLVWIGSAAARSLDADTDELGAVVSLAMMALHKVVAAEAGPSNVTANAVLKGGSATDADVAAAVAFLCSQGAGYLTGVTITVDGGVGAAVF